MCWEMFPPTFSINVEEILTYVVISDDNGLFPHESASLAQVNEDLSHLLAALVDGENHRHRTPQPWAVDAYRSVDR